MSGTNATEAGSGIALDGLMRMLIQESSQTNKKIERFEKSTSENISELTKVVKTLVESGIKADERQIQNDEKHERHEGRSDRIEDNQKSLGQKVERMSDAFISVSKDIEMNAARWAAMYKILSGLFTTILGAAIIAGYIANK